MYVSDNARSLSISQNIRKEPQTNVCLGFFLFALQEILFDQKLGIIDRRARRAADRVVR